MKRGIPRKSTTIALPFSHNLCIEWNAYCWGGVWNLQWTFGKIFFFLFLFVNLYLMGIRQYA